MLRWTLLLLLLTSCAPAARDTNNASPRLHVDHVILGVADLNKGVEQFERLTGVRPTVGGPHPGKGTRNALVSLGEGTYLEIYAPNPKEPVASADVKELLGLSELTPLGWAVSGPGLDALRTRFSKAGVAVSPADVGSRMRPDGTLLEWVTFGFDDFENPLAPFFIHWKEAASHPSRTAPSGCRLAALTILDPDPASLARRVAALRLDVDVRGARTRQMKVQLSCPTGSVTFGSPTRS